MRNTERGAGRVRDLCRRLKPVIGNQAERIWLAYVAENDAGKKQIEDYLELLAVQHFHGTLESQGPGLVPPAENDAAGPYVLGAVAYNQRRLRSNWMQLSRSLPHRSSAAPSTSIARPDTRGRRQSPEPTSWQAERLGLLMKQWPR